MAMFGDVGKWTGQALGKAGVGGILTGEKAPVGEKYKVNEAAFQRTPQQRQYLQYLADKAYGGKPTGPSAAEMMLQRQTDRSVKQMSGAMGSTRGVTDPSLIAYQTARMAGEAQQDATGQAAILRSQEDILMPRSVLNIKIYTLQMK